MRKYRTKALAMMKFVYYIQTEIFLKLKLGVLPLPSFLSSLRLASRHFLACSKATSSMTLTGYLYFFKCGLKLENITLRLQGSKSWPSFCRHRYLRGSPAKSGPVHFALEKSFP